jgi:uncharacterized membrane protein YphA (DoxX/SURF4 family)
VSVPLIVMMLVAMFTVHLRYGFSAINTVGLTAEGPQFGPPGYEVNLLYIAGLLALISLRSDTRAQELVPTCKAAVGGGRLGHSIW